jgi:tRNA threonylcarbamoyladenosine modification (KEOPS) complex Cgi121 subunit
MVEVSKQEEYLGYSITRVPRDNSEEMLLLCRRINYLTTSNSVDDYYDIDSELENLKDVDSVEKVLEQLTNIYKIQ